MSGVRAIFGTASDSRDFEQLVAGRFGFGGCYLQTTATEADKTKQLNAKQWQSETMAHGRRLLLRSARASGAANQFRRVVDFRRHFQIITLSAGLSVCRSAVSCRGGDLARGPSDPPPRDAGGTQARRRQPRRRHQRKTMSPIGLSMQVRCARSNFGPHRSGIAGAWRRPFAVYTHRQTDSLIETSV